MALAHHLEKLLREGMSLHGQGRLADAADRYARVRAVAPGSFDAWNLGGHVALAVGQPAEAVRLLSRALELHPGATATTLSLAVARLANSELDAAESLLRATTEREPMNADAWRYLGLVHEAQNRLDLAAYAREQCVRAKPDAAGGWIDYGSTLSLLGRQTDALTCFHNARRVEPQNLRARVGEAMVRLRCHRVAEAAAELGAVLQQTPGDLLAWSFRLTALHNLAEVTRDALFEEHRAYGRLVGAPAATSWNQSRDPDRPLRIGFLSRDLYEHSVAYFLEPLLRSLDPEPFQTFVYSDNTRRDGMTTRLRSCASQWREIAGRTDDAVQQEVRSDGIDVFVELAGHTAHNRLPLVARRLAPVQVTYLGYPDTTGVPAIDYRFVDALTDPPGEADRFATETLIRFAPTAWTYEPPADAPEVAPLPSAGARGVTFGAFNNFGKVTDQMLRRWAEILGAVPDSRLLIKASGLPEPAVADPLRARLGAAGIAGNKVELLPHTQDTASHLAAYGQVDIALDTAPYNGTTTTCEALWMGVPVVTEAGDHHAARVGLSLLTAVGRPEWVARSGEDYVANAVRLARDRAQLAEIRTGLRDAMRRSVLLDHRAQAQRFGAALRQCWRVWCERDA